MDAKSALRGFDYSRQTLFATDEKRVEAYAVVREEEFFRRLLNDPNFSPENPLFGLTLAEATGEPAAVRREVASCVQYLQDSPDSLSLGTKSNNDHCTGAH